MVETVNAGFQPDFKRFMLYLEVSSKQQKLGFSEMEQVGANFEGCSFFESMDVLGF